ncbi:polysialyltransferase family glycosyltransferase [Edwardsiella tarda]|uniref:polysialyltransferase family glycosyltransferase n=1 Tax=Edwardsiella tarda TaxID=636 RepID=UPI0002EA5AF5|nr:polysialyltransferase family glycosyltransferase [Edwardsiella tarda]
MDIIVSHNYHTLIDGIKFSKKINDSIIIYSSDAELPCECYEVMSDLGIRIINVSNKFNSLIEAHKILWLFPLLFDFLFGKYIKSILPDINICKISNLYVFNDEERLSRFLIQKSKSYILLEEGMANYHSFNRSRLLHWLTTYLPFIRDIPVPLGRHHKCKRIFLKHYNHDVNIPFDILKKVDFIDYGLLSENVLKKLQYLFKVDTDNSKYDFIIITQPIEVYGRTLSEKVAVFSLIIERMSQITDKSKIAIKIHPKEKESDYKLLGCDIYKGFPVELLSSFFDGSTFVSFYSSCELKNHTRLYENVDDFVIAMHSDCLIDDIKERLACFL